MKEWEVGISGLPFLCPNVDGLMTDELTYQQKIEERNRRQEQINDLSPYLRSKDVNDPWGFLSFFFAAPPPDPATNQHLPIPIPRQSIPWMNKVLWDCGVRIHPELAVLHKVPLQNGMGWQDPGVWLNNDEYAEWREKISAEGGVEQPGDAPVTSEMYEEMLNLLEKANPDLAALIREATPEQREFLKKRQDPERFNRIIKLLMEEGADDVSEPE